MKGKLSDVSESCSVDFEFELSETPEEMISRLLKRESQEVVQSLFNGGDGYLEAKANGSFGLAESSIAVKLGIDLERLDWKDTLQAQIGDKLKTLDPKESVHFVATISKAVG